MQSRLPQCPFRISWTVPPERDRGTPSPTLGAIGTSLQSWRTSVNLLIGICDISGLQLIKVLILVPMCTLLEPQKEKFRLRPSPRHACPIFFAISSPTPNSQGWPIELSYNATFKTVLWLGLLTCRQTHEAPLTWTAII